ncbi:NAD-binding protein [Thermosporothrix hazakensis]|nr:NAD-binding protein [Thermosporothrix hazakensis]
MGNFLIVSAGQSLREALSVAENNGVDPKAVLDMLTTAPTLFPSPIYQGHGKRIVEDTQAAPFRQRKIPLKDVSLFTKTAQQVELSTPIAHLLSDLLRSDEARA